MGERACVDAWEGTRQHQGNRVPSMSSGLYAVHGFSLESHRKLCLVLLAPRGVYSVPVSRPRGAPSRWQAGIFQAEAQLLPLFLHGEP